MSMNVEPSTRTDLLDVSFDYELNMIDSNGNVVEDTWSVSAEDYLAGQGNSSGSDSSDDSSDSSDDGSYDDSSYDDSSYDDSSYDDSYDDSMTIHMTTPMMTLCDSYDEDY